MFVTEAQQPAGRIESAALPISEQLAQGGLLAQSAPHVASVAYAVAHAFKTTTADGPCKQLAPAMLPGQFAPQFPLLACVASSMSSASRMLEGAAAALRIVRVAQAESLTSLSLQAAQAQRPADIVVGVHANSVQDIVLALVGDTPAPEVHALARSAARRSLSIAVAAGPTHSLQSNETGNCTRPWTDAEVDDYQVYVWVVVLLVFMVAGAFICLACTIAGDEDPVLYSAFQASDFHAHAD